LCTYREVQRGQRRATRTRATATVAEPWRVVHERGLVLPLGLAKKEEGVQALMWRHYITFILQLSCTRLLPVPSSARTELWESRPPEPPFVSGHLLGCVWAIRFLGSISVIARCLRLHWNVFISFLVSSSDRYFPVDVRGTALHTSSYNDCGPRL